MFGLDTNPFENFFTNATNSESEGLWDSLIDAGGNVIDKIPETADGLFSSWWSEEQEDKVSENENITSSSPAVAGSANAPTSVLPKLSQTQMIVAGVSTLAVLAIVIKKL